MKVGIYSEHIYNYLKKEATFAEIINLKDEASAKKDIEILIKGSLKRYELQPYENLRALLVPFTGLDSISQDAVREAGIQLFNSHAHAPIVAERALAMLLAITGKLLKAHRALAEGNWIGRDINDPASMWVSLRGKKVGLLGYGAIGKEIHKLLKTFDCKVVLLDRGKEYPEEAILESSINNLVTESDAIIVTLPLTEETEGLIGAKLLSLMAGKYLVNVGRGKVIDEDALYRTIVEGKIEGFASDVWYNYPDKGHSVVSPSKYDFSRFDNVLMTPHNAGFEARAEDMIMEDLLGILKKLNEGIVQKPVEVEQFY